MCSTFTSSRVLQEEQRNVFLSISLVFGPSWVSNGQLEQHSLPGGAGVSSLCGAGTCECMCMEVATEDPIGEEL